MLNKGTKSEEDRRIESIVQKLSSMGFVPEDATFVESLDEELNKIGLTYQELLTISTDELPKHIQCFNFGWDHMEQFTDILVKWSTKEPSFKVKAKALYQFIQDESKAFSFNIMTKISSL
ncbi:hypothetical protein [Myroides sp. N17-2]|uniref:hypothetical protein n=1 Tax=Myroides sp. N17-2 TaxID=2030799 RepID=UPI000EFD0359|nr:hypothetical protein [Myroides sp. N17-2]